MPVVIVRHFETIYFLWWWTWLKNVPRLAPFFTYIFRFLKILKNKHRLWHSEFLQDRYLDGVHKSVVHPYCFLVTGWTDSLLFAHEGTYPSISPGFASIVDVQIYILAEAETHTKKSSSYKRCLFFPFSFHGFWTPLHPPTPHPPT